MCKIMPLSKRILRCLGNGPARRNLFGPVDREQLQLEYRDLLQKDLEEASHRWGFDFALEKPLEDGDYLWEGVPGGRVPALYRSCVVGKVQRGAETTSTVAPTKSKSSPEDSEVGKENIPRSPESYGKVLQDLEKTPEKKQVLKRKQTNITDFYQAKRRVVATSRKSGQ